MPNVDDSDYDFSLGSLLDDDSPNGHNGSMSRWDLASANLGSDDGLEDYRVGGIRERESREGAEFELEQLVAQAWVRSEQDSANDNTVVRLAEDGPKEVATVVVDEQDVVAPVAAAVPKEPLPRAEGWPKVNPELKPHLPDHIVGRFVGGQYKASPEEKGAWESFKSFRPTLVSARQDSDTAGVTIGRPEAQWRHGIGRHGWS